MVKPLKLLQKNGKISKLSLSRQRKSNLLHVLTQWAKTANSLLKRSFLLYEQSRVTVTDGRRVNVITSRLTLIQRSQRLSPLRLTRNLKKNKTRLSLKHVLSKLFSKRKELNL